MSATRESVPTRPAASAAEVSGDVVPGAATSTPAPGAAARPGASATSGTTAAPASSAGSQTLSRGIRVLEILADAERPLSIGELSEALGLHRSIAYRMVRTLEDHSLVIRDAAGALQLGPGLAALARSVSRDVQSAALPELTALANRLGMTAFLTLLDVDSVVTLVSVEPRHAGAAVAQRPGSRHALDVGAPGAAILSLLPAGEVAMRGLAAPALSVFGVESGAGAGAGAGGDGGGSGARPAAAAVGVYAVSRDEVISGLSSVAVPLSLPGQPPAALAVVYVSSSVEPEVIAAALHRAASAVAADLL